MYTVNPELMALAQVKFEKVGFVPPGGDPAAMGGAPAAAPPMDPAAMGAVPPVAPADPASAMAAMAPAPAAPPPPMPPATPTETPAAPQGQKLKPEQMMQMIDFRMYNMQQILTAIANALNVQIDPSVLVLPPGTTGAPPAETALPGGPMAPPPMPPQDPAAAGGMPPGAMPPGAMPPEAMPKTANWWEPENANSIAIGTPVDQPRQALHMRAAALQALRRSLATNED